MKKNNPNTPILIREATGTSPKVWARYGYGKEKSETLEGMIYTPALLQSCLHRTGLSDKEIEDKVTRLVKTES
jgi:NADH dehydrogenase (ubiquinone) 1 alpha subcomplex subunit 2